VPNEIVFCPWLPVNNSVKFFLTSSAEREKIDSRFGAVLCQRKFGALEYRLSGSSTALGMARTSLRRHLVWRFFFAYRLIATVCTDEYSTYACRERQHEARVDLVGDGEPIELAA
jgi:hypothetical protein